MRLVLLHRQCYDVLVERGLSAHLMIDRDGAIYQALDLQTACAFHAGQANARSVGLAASWRVRLCPPGR
ncbi:MAG TPA: N-acetylmuramoyl-L-alanine amidase [Polyangia bacterium]|jgi:N-acetylmuramoyl-L-alanine amidase.|nr:N-acetylmuramoyl-L-alanine amidase [Polyangia bacterium]